MSNLSSRFSSIPDDSLVMPLVGLEKGRILKITGWLPKGYRVIDELSEYVLEPIWEVDYNNWFIRSDFEILYVST